MKRLSRYDVSLFLCLLLLTCISFSTRCSFLLNIIYMSGVMYLLRMKDLLFIEQLKQSIGMGNRLHVLLYLLISVFHFLSEKRHKYCYYIFIFNGFFVRWANISIIQYRILLIVLRSEFGMYFLSVLFIYLWCDGTVNRNLYA